MSGLTRYRSAPSSYFSGIMSGGGAAGGGFGADDFGKLFNPRASSPETQRIFTNFMNSTDENFSVNPPPSLPPRQKVATAKKPPQKRQNSDRSTSSRMMHQSPHCGGNSGLIRQSSSPAGLFDSINMGIGMFDEDCGNESDNIPWDDPAFLSDNFLKRLAEEDSKIFAKLNPRDDQKSEGGNRPQTRLSHHLSLPKSFADFSAVEKLLQDSVPCKLRAKRGRATHPRSIAERVRRNKISERTRKLQQLVPNMEKQVNTADMLDLAVDYIKDLQRQLKMLSDNRAKCTCSPKLKP